MSKFTKSPLSPEKQAEIERFVSGAVDVEKPAIIPPQIKADVSQAHWSTLDDVEKTKGINLRMTKADLEKLRHISNTTPYSIQGFCYEAVKTAIERALKQ